MKRGMIVEWRLWIAGALLMVMASCGFGQWDQVIFLTDDNHHYLHPSLVVDDSLRLHVFCARSVVEYPSSEWARSLYYQRFDNWGNPLSEPLDLMPDTIYANVYQPGVLLDSDGHTIHVVWSRTMNVQPFLHQTFYARLNIQGQIEIPPFEIPSDDALFYAPSVVNLVEDGYGNLWIAAYSQYAVVDSNGVIVQSLQSPVPDAEGGERLMFNRDPAGHIWLCFRHFRWPEPQQISLMRVDTSALVPEAICSQSGPGEEQMGPQAFFIDNSGAFHYILYRDAAGLFYERDQRDGSPVDTTVFDSNPYGVGTTWFTLVGGDTLHYMYGQEFPSGGFIRVAFELTGQLALSPSLITPQPFGLEDYTPLIWKEGGYWTIGHRSEFQPTRIQLCLLHVPGPNEPPNAVNDKLQEARAQLLSVAVSPNPVQNELRLNLSAIPTSRVSIKLYNLLGQEIQSREFESLNASIIRLPLARNLPAGSYYGQVITSRQILGFTFVRL